MWGCWTVRFFVKSPLLLNRLHGRCDANYCYRLRESSRVELTFRPSLNTLPVFMLVKPNLQIVAGCISFLQ
jgi:hypothetical protein